MTIIPKDLLYIVSKVEEWPDEKLSYVRLDFDGEICFGPSNTIEHDFYPEGKFNSFLAHPSFVPNDGYNHVGKQYSFTDYLLAKGLV